MSSPFLIVALNPRRRTKKNGAGAGNAVEDDSIALCNAPEVPPTLLVLFLTRRNGGEGAIPGVIGGRVGVPPRVAVARDGLVTPIELPAEREGAARLLGAVALPAWVHNEEFAPPPEHMDLRRRAVDVHRSMDMSSATESRARQQDLGPALEAAGLRPSDYLDIDLKGNRNAFRELRNTRDDISLLLDAEDLDDVRWILDTAQLGGNGEPDIAMGWLWDPASKDEVLKRFRELEAHAARSTSAPASGWQLAVPDVAVVAGREGEEASESAEREGYPGPDRKLPRGPGYLVGAAVLLVLLAAALLLIRGWSDDPVKRPAGVVLRVDNRTTSGRQVREDPARLPLTTRPVPNCGRRGCVVQDTPTWESDQQIDRAVCQQQGERITNGNDTSKADDDNPLLDDTTLYYGVSLKDGTSGYVAEIWIARKQRGGLSLPPCSTVLPRLPRR